MNERKAISKRVRFEVLKRDKFACQYCGRRAPDVLLVIDHVIPVVKGGTADILNLITSCDDCNSGKGARQLADDSALRVQLAQLDKLQEKREQLELLLQWREEISNLDEEQVDLIEDEIRKYTDTYDFSLNDHGRKETRKLVKKYGLSECLDAAQVAFDKYFKAGKDREQSVSSFSFAFQKMSSVLYLNERTKTDPLIPVLYKMRACLSRKCRYINSWKVLQMLRELFRLGYLETQVWELVNAADNWHDFQEGVNRLITNAQEGAE